MADKLRISAVSYLNTKPFLAGMEKSGILNDIHLSLDIPSLCASKLLEGTVDIGLVPVAVLPLMKEYHIVTNYCIGATGPVRSVVLYSQVPLSQIKNILLDNQSRTSVALVRILCRELWKINPEWTYVTDGYEKDIQGTTAGVVIGDRTFGLNKQFKYTYDLAEGWKELTGLPFVFACWVSNKSIPEAFGSRFDKALEEGVKEAGAVAEQYKNQFPPDAGLDEYLTRNLSYSLDEAKRKGLALFLDKLNGIPLV
jgi:chorismate dehydratase